MPYYIKKNTSIQKRDVEVYYQGNQRWSTEFHLRKIYENEIDANNDLYIYGGEVISE